MTVRLPADQAEALATVASVENRPVSEVIRTAIAAHVDTKRNDPKFQRDLKASVERAQRLLAAMDTGADELRFSP